MNSVVTSELVPLSDEESRMVTGGTWFVVVLAIAIVFSAMENFGDIRQGFMDGLQGTPRYTE